MFCSDLIKTSWLIFSSETPSLLYYSHIPTALAAVFLGIFVLLNNRKGLLNIIYFILNISYGLLIFLNLILWTNSYIPIIIFIWPITQILFVIVPILSIYFFYVFLYKKDVSILYKIIWSVIILLLIGISFSKINFSSFNSQLCEPNLTGVIFLYQNIVFVIIFIALIFLFINSLYKKVVPGKEHKEFAILFIGIILFLISFTITWQIAENYEYFNLEQYGLFGMTLLLVIVSFIIVRFKAFNIKLLGAQALVWAMIILVGSQFFYLGNMPLSSIIITSLTLVVSSIVGLMIVRSVKKEDALVEELEIANNNQQSLIHFISHQLKGFFTKSKMIFAGIIENDFGQSSETLVEVAKEGLQSDDNAVAMIQDILGASNLKKGTTTYNMKAIDFSEVVKGMCNSFEKEISERGLKLERNISETPIIIAADKTQITQVVKNLIDNSIKYTKEGKIKVSLGIKNVDSKQKVDFAIEDTGVGLSESDKNKLFTEGGKGDDSLKINVNSTGYGLYIVKKIVENHGGKIWAESEGRGLGSRFFVELDVVK